jgi:hypothetical protein
MDFRTELAKWGYNKGNSIDVEILVNEILPSLFSQQERSYSEEEVFNLLMEFSSRDINSSSRTPHSVDNWFEQFKKK